MDISHLWVSTWVESINSLYSCSVTLASLGLSGVSLEEEQLLRQCMTGRVCLPAHWLWQEYVLINTATSNGAQTGWK